MNAILANEVDQSSLDALRAMRGQLYAIPGSVVGAMSLDDQIKYGDSLQRIGTAILRLEAARLKGVNDAFLAREPELKEATASLESDVASLNDSVKVIRTISDGLTLVGNIVALLA